MKRWLLAACLGTASALASVPALADPSTDDRRTVTGPDPTLFKTGALTLGLSYVPSLAVAAHSSRPEDRFLFAPVAGPWLDLGERRCQECRHELLNKALLIGDGIVQGVGAVEVVASFLFLETRLVNAKKPSEGHKAMRLEFTPIRVSGGYGLRATGAF